MHGGRLMKTFATEVMTLLGACATDPRMMEFIQPMQVEAQRLSDTSRALGKTASQDAEVIGAVANSYLKQFALVTLAYVWVKQVKAVIDRPEEDELRRSKLQTARYFFKLVLPEAELEAKRVAVGKEPMTDIDVDLL